MVEGEERSSNTINQRRGNVDPDEKNKKTTNLKGNLSKEWNFEVIITFINLVVYIFHKTILLAQATFRCYPTKLWFVAVVGSIMGRLNKYFRMDLFS